MLGNGRRLRVGDAGYTAPAAAPLRNCTDDETDDDSRPSTVLPRTFAVCALQFREDD